MQKRKNSIPKARSYVELGEFWDEHDLNQFWGKSKKVKFNVVLEPEATYYLVEKNLSKKVQSVARKRGVSSNALVNRRSEQKVKEQKSGGTGRKLVAKG